jgi:hypothetical protein
MGKYAGWAEALAQGVASPKDRDMDADREDSPIVDWLLDSDPAIRWQVLKDLLDAPTVEYEAERARVSHEGWGAHLLRLQDASGLWGGSLYSGKWVSTTYTLHLLKLLGLPPKNEQALRGCSALLDGGLHAGTEIRFSRDRGIRDLGVTGMILSLCCYFDHDAESLHNIARVLVSEQHRRGEWIPDDRGSAEDYAFETTLIVLEALNQYRERCPDRDQAALGAAIEDGQEFLVRHHLFLRDGQRIKARWTTFSFPPYWFFDVLTALDYLHAARANRDERIEPAIELVRNRRRADGTWSLGSAHPGKTHLSMEQPGKPSRWNTLRATRVLKWWGVSRDACRMPRLTLG